MPQVGAGVLSVTYEVRGPTDGIPVVLLHGFPYDVAAYDEVSALLVRQGFRTYAPYLRGYGGTTFLVDSTPRSGEQRPRRT